MTKARISALVGGALLLAMTATVAPAAAHPAPRRDSVTVARVAPSAGPTRGGERVSVWGSGFRHVRAVTFGAVRGRSVHVISSRHLTVVVPAHYATTDHVRVHTATFTSRRTSADRFTFISPPAITEVAPFAGATKGGGRIRISGFDLHAPVRVWFGGVLGTSVHVASTHLLSVVPPAHTAGLVDVRVTTPYGVSRVVRTDHFTYHNPPVVTGVSPASVPSTVGSQITISGSGFDAETMVYSGTDYLGASIDSATSLRVMVPDVTPGWHVLTITSPWGTAHATYSVYQAPATGMSVTPRVGGHADLSWVPPYEPYPVWTTIRRADGSTPPATPTDGTPIARVGGATFTDDSVTPGSSYSYAIFEDDGNGHVSAALARSVTIPRDPITTVGSADLVDPPAGHPSSISCTADQCLAVDLQGSSRIFDGTSWSAPVPTGAQPGRSYNLSCATDSFCAYLDVTGAGVMWDGHDWTALPALTVAGYVSGVSCPVAGWCAVTGNHGEAAVLSNGAWQATQLGPHNWNDVSCASTTSCLAVAFDGSITRYDGTAWSVPTVPAAGLHLTAVSCATESWCAAVGYEANETAYVVTWNGAAWSTPTLVDPTERGLMIDCPAVETCVVGGGGTHAVALANGTWSAPVAVDPAATGATLLLGCRSATTCVAVDSRGDAATFDGTNWSGPALFDPLSGNVTGLSCVAGDDCVLVDRFGYAAVRTAGAWSKPAHVAGAGNLSGVSCATATFCVAAGTFQDSPTSASYDAVSAFDGQHWSAPIPVDNTVRYLSAVSCPTDRFCMVVGEQPSPDGFIAVAQAWDGQTWSPLVQLGHANAPEALTCPTDTFCLAAGNGAEWRWSSGTWTQDEANPGVTSPPAGAACFSAGACIVVAGSGNVYRWTGDGWVVDPRPAPNFVLGVACSAPTYCITTHGDGGLPQFADYDGSTWSTTALLPGVDPAYTSLRAIPACGTTCFVATPDGRVVATSH